MLKVTTLAAGLLLAMVSAARANCCDTINDCGSCWTTTPVPAITIGESSLTGCDSNEKTPNEAVDCKLAYWKVQVEKLQKERVDLDGKIARAAERLDAFKAAGGHLPAAKP
ncbi:MAG: hypothetical protein EPO08_06470 [Rhodospirillaceae bacterium]|nr:MAG: hypothetical protein EPO08_06470 [Rhodospirillaceae bacterium]